MPFKIFISDQFIFCCCDKVLTKINRGCRGEFTWLTLTERVHLLRKSGRELMKEPEGRNLSRDPGGALFTSLPSLFS